MVPETYTAVPSDACKTSLEALQNYTVTSLYPNVSKTICCRDLPLIEPLLAYFLWRELKLGASSYERGASTSLTLHLLGALGLASHGKISPSNRPGWSQVGIYGCLAGVKSRCLDRTAAPRGTYKCLWRPGSGIQVNETEGFFFGPRRQDIATRIGAEFSGSVTCPSGKYVLGCK